MTAPVLTLTSTYTRKAIRIGSLSFGAALRATASSICIVLLSASSAERIDSVAAALPGPLNGVMETLSAAGSSALSGLSTLAAGAGFPVLMIGATALVGALGGALGAAAFNRRESRYR
jgi:hypothetical protein